MLKINLTRCQAYKTGRVKRNNNKEEIEKLDNQ